MTDDPLAGFPVKVDIPVAWGEMDAFGHVNNVVYFRYFESARIAYFAAVGYMDLMRATGVGPILAATECRFRLPLEYPDTVTVGARVAEIEEDAFLMRYFAVSRAHGRVAAEGSGRIVSYDYEQKRRAPLQAILRERLEHLESCA
ncbi:MAG: acyl-CoA thioesterase [Gammaproteobacteria bacterium]